MNAKQLREKSARELDELLVELRKEQFGLRMRHGSGQLEQPHELRRVRRDIARIKMVRGQMQDESKS